MGPHSSEQGNLDYPDYWNWYKGASMGPHSSEQGNRTLPESRSRSERRFNGASLFRARKPCKCRRRRHLPCPSFNGASLFRARKLLLAFVCLIHQLTASMGPHSSEQGNTGDNLYYQMAGIGFNGASLFRARKPAHWNFLVGQKAVLQWGLTLPSKETGLKVKAYLDTTLLQWGLTLPSKETSLGRKRSL